jgi:hypothetical protein
MDEEAEITCDHCKKAWPLSKILRHIAQSTKGCKKNYVSDRYNFVKQQVDEASKAKRKRYNTEYYDKNKEERKKASSQNYASKTDERKKSFSQNYASKTDERKKSFSQYYASNKEERKKSFSQNYASNKEEKKKSFSQNYASNKVERKIASSQNYEKNKEKRQQQFSQYYEDNKELRRKNARDNLRAEDRLINFKQEIIDGPHFICQSCNRSLFKNSTKVFDIQTFTNLMSKHKLDDQFLLDIGLDITSNISLCHTCLRLIKFQRFPSINFMNGLELENIPEELKLADLEQQLIARSLLFLKIKKLPKSRMKANVDRVINVPVECDDISETLKKLPRHPDDAKIVAVQLKRRLKYQNSHLAEYIRPKAVVDAVKTLKRLGNPFYQDIAVDENFLDKPIVEIDTQMETESEKRERLEDERWELEASKARHNRRLARQAKKDAEEAKRAETNREPQDSLFCIGKKKDMEDGSESENEDEISTVHKAVREQQSRQDSNTFLVPKDMANQVVKNNDKSSKKEKSIEIAPGEGKIPSNMMRDENFDVKAFPKYHPSGKFGLHYKRNHKLSAQMYFNQRLLNKDDRFSRDPCYVFMASYFIERQGIERQIDISGKTFSII